jgi:hypothetical protein
VTISAPARTALDEIVNAALMGERCPINAAESAGGLPRGATTELARAGLIRVEVYPHNWRVIEILQGPHAGKRTAPPPNRKWRPYLIVDEHGSLRRDRDYAQASARKVTLPTVRLP